MPMVSRFNSPSDLPTNHKTFIMTRTMNCSCFERRKLSKMVVLLCLGLLFPLQSVAFQPPPQQQPLSAASRHGTDLRMVANSLASGWSVPHDNDWNDDGKRRMRKKYQRKREKPQTEKESDRLRRIRQAKYEAIANKGSPSIFNFESLFPEPVIDEETVHRDLYEIIERDEKLGKQLSSTTQQTKKAATASKAVKKMQSSAFGSNSMMRAWREPKLSSSVLSFDTPTSLVSSNVKASVATPLADTAAPTAAGASTPIGKVQSIDETAGNTVQAVGANSTTIGASPVVDRALSRMVEDKIFGYRRTHGGAFEYDTSLMGDGAVQFRDGVRLGNALKVNADVLTYHARKELARGRVEEAEELYEKAIEVDPRDGRGYLGLSRVAERRRDFKLAKECLRAGIARSVSPGIGDQYDRGGNPFLLQALGCLEEKAGHLSEAESLYIAAAKSRPSHAAAWVALAQLRTRKLRQSAAAGRVCFQTAERELKRAGLPASSHVYTAWASMEYKKAGDVRRARELFQAALEVDSKCSPALLQLGVMEADKENWDEAEMCFERVLKNDQRNSRVLQAYAIMESKRPEGDSRKAIELFERALKVKPRDAGVLQAYALYVAKLGDIDAAREMLKVGTQVNKRYAPIWQAWGVLETRHGSAKKARELFQQGIWSCATISGNRSGGYKCARLWQAWGVLEAREGDHEAARRCFSRALDADNRNVAAITAWTLMEEELGNIHDARLIFERCLNRFPVSDDKMALWRNYELMEQRAGNKDSALQVYQRSMRESIGVRDHNLDDVGVPLPEQKVTKPEPSMNEVLQKSKEVEVVRWGSDSTSLRGDVWMNNGSIEGKMPMKNRKMRNNSQR